MAIVDESTTAYLDLRGVLDPAKEVEKLRKKQAEVSYSSTHQNIPLCIVLHVNAQQGTASHQHSLTPLASDSFDPAQVQLQVCHALDE